MSRHAHGLTLRRWIADWAIPQLIPGRHHPIRTDPMTDIQERLTHA